MKDKQKKERNMVEISKFKLIHNIKNLTLHNMNVAQFHNKHYWNEKIITH